MRISRLRDFIKQYLNIGRVFGYANGISIFFKIKVHKNIILKLPNYKERIYLRGDTSDISVFNQIFIKKEYEITDLLPDFKPEFIIDGGANIGLGSIYFQKNYPSAKIIAIEPAEENFEVLKKNILNYTNISPLKGAIWYQNKNLKIADKFNQGYFSLVVSENQSDSDSENVHSIYTIGSLFSLYNIGILDILKLDVETAEKHIFSSNYDSWLGKCKVIIIELHDVMEKGCSMAFFQAVQSSIKNYSLYIKGENIVLVNEDL